MKPLATIEPPETVPGFIDGYASRARSAPTAEGGVGILLIGFSRFGVGPASLRGRASGTCSYTGYFDAVLAQPRELKRSTKANDTILLKTGEKQ